jgi:transcriptional regulator
MIHYIALAWYQHFLHLDIQFKIDTGADLSVVPEYVFKKLKNIKLVKADKILFGPGQKQLQVLGKLDSYSYYGSVIFHICCIYRWVAFEPVVVLELFSVETLTAVYFYNVTLQRQGLREVEDYGFLGEVNSNDSETWIINLKVKDTDIQFKIDTGADLSVVPEYVFKKLKNIKLVKALTIIPKIEIQAFQVKNFVILSLHIIPDLILHF